MITKQEDYNNVPVHYCKSCLSIKIKEVALKREHSSMPNKVTYCGNCDQTEIETSHIDEWNDKYVERYGKKFLDE